MLRGKPTGHEQTQESLAMLRLLALSQRGGYLIPRTSDME
jgi:hypothetical protein